MADTQGKPGDRAERLPFHGGNESSNLSGDVGESGGAPGERSEYVAPPDQQPPPLPDAKEVLAQWIRRVPEWQNVEGIEDLVLGCLEQTALALSTIQRHSPEAPNRLSIRFVTDGSDGPWALAWQRVDGVWAEDEVLKLRRRVYELESRLRTIALEVDVALDGSGNV